jgi:hypothetical protein
MPSKGTAYNLEVTRRQPLTEQNLKELCIDRYINQYLNDQNSPIEFAVAYDAKTGQKVKPIGISINEVRYGQYPASTQTAAERGWITYMTLGEPLIEERSDITPPTPDTLSSRVYVNRSSTACKFEDTVEFTVSNTISWSIEGSVQLTFGARIAAEIQKMIEAQYTNHQLHKLHNHKDEQGPEDENGVAQTFTSQETASGTAELSAQLMLGITASVSGSLTTSWNSQSTISGDVAANSRVATRATQRRVLKQYKYQIPVTFAGYFAAIYDVPVNIQDYYAQPASGSSSANVIALNIVSENKLVDGKPFRNIFLPGTANDVSTLAVEHTVFEKEALSNSDQPLYDQPLYTKNLSQTVAEPARI